MTQGPRSAPARSPHCWPGAASQVSVNQPLPSPVGLNLSFLSLEISRLSPSPSHSQAEPPWWPRGSSCPPAPPLPYTCHRCSEPGLGLLRSSLPPPAGGVSGVPPDTCPLQSPPAPSTVSLYTDTHNHTYIDTDTHTCTHTQSHRYTHRHTQMHAYTQRHTYMYTDTQRHTPTQTRILKIPLVG